VFLGDWGTAGMVNGCEAVAHSQVAGGGSGGRWQGLHRVGMR
jgi:hypothetical protein